MTIVYACAETRGCTVLLKGVVVLWTYKMAAHNVMLLFLAFLAAGVIGQAGKVNLK